MTTKDLARTLKTASEYADRGLFSAACGMLEAAVREYIKNNKPATGRKEQLTFAATLPTGLPVIAQVDEWSDAGQVCAVFVGDHDIADDLTDEAKSALDARFVEALAEEAWEVAEYRAELRREGVV